MHLDYYEQFLVSSGSTNTWYVFRLNSIYDPNWQSGGQQPLFYSQLAGLYQYYKVVGAEVSLESNNNSTSTDAFISMCPSVYSPINSGAITYASQHPLSVSTFSTRSPGNKQHSKVKMPKINIGTLFNIPIVEDNFSAAFTANPLNQAFVNICFNNPVVSSSLNIYNIIRIRYHVHVYGLVNVAPT